MTSGLEQLSDYGLGGRGSYKMEGKMEGKINNDENFNNGEGQYISLREASEKSGYSSDYIGQLVRAGRIRGEKVYEEASWQTTPEEILRYCGKLKNLEPRDSSLLNKKQISLKEAAEISGYNPDYIGSLLRNKEIKGEKAQNSFSWLVNEEDVLSYKADPVKSLRSHEANKTDGADRTDKTDGADRTDRTNEMDGPAQFVSLNRPRTRPSYQGPIYDILPPQSNQKRGAFSRFLQFFSSSLSRGKKN